MSPQIVLWCNVGSLHALSLSRTRKRELRCLNIISWIDKALHLTHHHTKRDCSLRLLHVRTRYCVGLLLRVTVVAYKCWFLLRDAMQARPMASCGVCPSVCLSASHVRGFCLKAAFHYSCQLQTWSKACWKPAANLLKTGFSSFHLSSTRTNQRTCCGSRPCFRQKSRKLVESVSQTCTNLSKPGCKRGRKPGLQPGLQLARIMECGLYGKR